MASSDNFIPETQESPKEDGGSDAGGSSAEQHRDRGESCVDGEEKMFLVEETTLARMPEHMKILLERLPDESLTPDTLLEAVLYLLIVECGFCHVRHPTDTPVLSRHGVFYSYPRVKELAASVPLNFFTPVAFGSFRENHFHLLTFGHFTLITYRIADILCATFTQQSHQGYSIGLSVSRYIPLVNRQNIQRSFRNLQELSLRAKNKLILPARDVAMQIANPGSIYPSLVGTPVVPLNKIFRQLPKSSMKTLRDLFSTSSQLESLYELIDQIHAREPAGVF